MVLIRSRDNEWVFPLSAEETITVSGPLGDTTVKISGKRAWVESSPCKNQTCTTIGYIQRQGTWSACLPNNVLLMIEGSDEQDVDAIVQ